MDIAMHPLAFSIISIVFGILILIFPRLLNYMVGFYLLIIGVLALIGYLK